MSSIPGSERSPGGHGNPLQYSCLENRAQLLCDMPDLPGPGIKPVSPALAGVDSLPLRYQQANPGPLLMTLFSFNYLLKDLHIQSHQERSLSMNLGWGGGHNSVYNKGIVIVSSVELVIQSFNSGSSQIYSIYFHRVFLSHISSQRPQDLVGISSSLYLFSCLCQLSQSHYGKVCCQWAVKNVKLFVSGLVLQASLW